MEFEANDSTHEATIEELYPDEKIEGNSISIVDIQDFLSQELPERKILLKPWLPSQGLAMVHAPRGIGKTHFGLAVGYVVACGSEFLGWKAPEPAGVLILDGEMPAPALQERLADIVRSNDKEPSKPLRFLTPDLQPKDRLSFNIADINDQRDLDKYLNDIDLIIVDNISTLCRSGKENEAEGWQPIQAWALQQRAQGRSVLFIHHSGKDGRQRGTSKREDVLDTVISLKQPSDYTQEQGARFEIRFEKARGFFGEDAEPMEAQLITDTNGTQQWTYKKLEDAIHEQILSLYEEGLSQKDIASEVGRNKSSISRHIKRAKAEGRIL